MYNYLKCVFTFTKPGKKIVSFPKYKKKYIFSNKYYSNKSINSKPRSVLFFGTDTFALESLQVLNHELKKGLLQRLEVVTAYKGEENDVIKYAKAHNITLNKWPPQVRVNEFEIGVVVSFGHMIPSRIIRLFPLGIINVHGSLLPRWRGAAPICHALINGDTRTGVSIMKIMPKRFDVGSVIAQKEVQIHPHETYLDLYKKLATLGANLLNEIMAKLPCILNTARAQVEKDATYAPKITPEMSFIKWNEMSAEDIYNLQRGLFTIQPLRAYFNSEVVKLLNITVVSGIPITHIPKKIPGLAVFNKKSQSLYILCKEKSWITVETVIIPGRRPQSATDFGTGFILSKKEKFCIFY